MYRKIFILFIFSVLSASFIYAQEKYTGQKIEDILELPEENINLSIAKLIVDKMVDPSIDINHYLSKLDTMVVEIEKILGPRTSSIDKMLAIKTYLFVKGRWNENQPFEYDFSDPLGRNYENKLVTNFIETKKGNCVSMPFLFLILGKKMGIDINASTAPLHVFVRFKDDLTGDVWNIETTNGGNPSRNIWYIQQFQIPEDAVRNGVYLQDLTNKETISVMLMEVEQFYIENQEFEKASQICDLALKYYPKYAYAMARKGNALAHILNSKIKSKGYKRKQDIPDDERKIYDGILKENLNWFKKAESLGWQEITKEFDEKYLEMVNKEINKMKEN
jgi:regulator of sirC expression with transglutaminase-like and TPR domain